ncbi:MAG: bifunctional ornithine acetyltransferase/N-acetylglutamate synthase [Coriobacteriales bacterium]|jgi:glutamate N-acetyltransferase/amino-acid N-acetyltransferase|nr:bifunctional ornithine acetyltransferase/N-acetylglutamate synthase [Coriobacteriales bacterium]
MVDSPAPLTQELPGGLGAVKGLQLAGVSAGFRKNPERLDLALIVAPPGSRAAGAFTQNTFAAAPVQLSREHLAAQAQAAGEGSSEGEGFRALIINSGNANAATGAEGIATARQETVLVAEALHCEPTQVLVASTGVIGVPLDVQQFVVGIPLALAHLSSGQGASVTTGRAAAEAIMTTDTVPKMAARSFAVQHADGSEASYTIGGMAKGSGMIAPDMATMIAVLATDALLEQDALELALKEAVAVSFNKVTIDSDTSTNDSAYLIGTGAAAPPSATSALASPVIPSVGSTGLAQGKGSAAEVEESLRAQHARPVGPAAITVDDPAFATFAAVLTEVCQDLAYQIARDGEGATRVIVVDVSGAASPEDASRVARAIADSPLVKTAIAGHDANWGRIAMAAGKAGVAFAQEEVSISILGLEVLHKGRPREFSEAEALQRFEERNEVLISVDLGTAGTASTRIWTCDLTHGYISINGEYRT